MFKTLALVALLLLPAASAAAQTPRFGRAVRSPEVHADGRVTFRFRAPGAKLVVLAREGAEPAPMSRDDSGTWALTVGPLAPDRYIYSFYVDGVALADPGNPLAKPVVVGGHESMVDILGTEADVPRGTLHRHVYRSSVVGETRAFVVYTPPGYDPVARTRYPVLVLLHGVMEDETAWTTAGRAHEILDDLIARRAAVPMIAVFPLGYGFPDAPDRVGELFSPATNQKAVMDVFARTLVDEILPRVERDYRTESKRESRAIAGVSMGGAQALSIGLNDAEQFAWVGALSPATIMFGADYGAFFARTGARPRLLWLSVGTEDFLLGPNRHFAAWLGSKGEKFASRETPGGHEWGVWRRDLRAFAPLLFRAEAPAR